MLDEGVGTGSFLLSEFIARSQRLRLYLIFFSLSPRNLGRARSLLAILAVAPVVALDLLYAPKPD